MERPPEQGSMIIPGHVFDPHLALTSLDSYAVTRTPSTSVFHVFVPLLLCFSCKVLLFFPALDAPSSTVCSAVPTQDRLLCASPPVSQGDCEAQGCCYDPRDRMKPCYFGNTGKPEQLSSLPPELLQNKIPPFAGRVGVYHSRKVAQGHVFGCQEYRVPVMCPALSSVLQQAWVYGQNHCCCWSRLCLSCHA